MSRGRTRFLILSAISAAVALVAMASQALATERWQFVQGDRYGFVLPDRPMGSQASFDAIMRTKETAFTPKLTLTFEDAKRTCPETAEIIERVYGRLVLQNNLNEFLQNGPGIKVFTTCADERDYRPVHNISAEAYGTTLVLPSGLVRGLNTEDEIAFVVAHEMSHILMGHTEAMLDVTEWGRGVGFDSNEYKAEVLEVREFSEAQADKYAAFLMWNAGYKVACSENAMKNYERFYYDFVQRLWVRLMGGTHGSSKERFGRLVSEVMVPAHMELTCPKTKSSSILKARRVTHQRESR